MATLVANTIIHIMVMATFLAIFFFTYAAFIERRVISKQTARIADTLVAETRAMIPEPANAQIRAAVQDLQEPDLSQADEAVQKSNESVIKRAVIGLGGLIVVGTGLLIALHFYSGGLPWQHILTHNALMLLVTATVEFVFLTGFAQWYQPTDAAFVKKTLIKAVHQWAGTP